MGKGGGSSQPQPQTVQQTTSNIPEYARPYFEDIMTRGQATSQVQYQPYTGERVAGFTPLQEQAFQGIQGLGPSPLVGAGAELTGAGIGQFASGSQYAPMQAQQTFQAPQYQGMGVGYLGTQAPQLQQYQMGAGPQVRTGSFAQPGAAAQYMSPYMQNVVDVQQREAQRQADIARTQRGAQAVGAGAFGGSRQAIMEAEAAKNLAQQKGDIQATGLQSAYQQAQQAYQTDAARQLQARMANQQAGLTAGQQNLAAALGVQQLGAQTGMQSQQLNQAAQLQAQQQALGQQQAGNLFAQQNAQLAAQYGLEGLRTAEQSRQFGADLGLQGAQGILSGAAQLGQLGQTAFGQQAGALQAQQQAGAIQQAQAQQRQDIGYEEFMRQQLYPQSQLQFLSSLLRGSVVAPQQTMYTYQQQQPAAAQLAGLAGGLGSLGKAFGAKDGGEIKSYAEGGITGEGEAGAFASTIAKLVKVGLADPRLIDRDMTASPLEKNIAKMKVAQMRQAHSNQEAMAQGIPQGTVLDSGIAGLDVEEPMFAAAHGGIVAFRDGGASGAAWESLPPYDPRKDPDVQEQNYQPFWRTLRLGPWAGTEKYRADPTGRRVSLGEFLRRQEQTAVAPQAAPAGINFQAENAAAQEKEGLGSLLSAMPSGATSPAGRGPAPAPDRASGPSLRAPAAAPSAPSAPSAAVPEVDEGQRSLERLMMGGQKLETPEEAEKRTREGQAKKFPSELKERLNELTAEAQSAVKQRDQDRWLAVAQGFFAAAAGRSPSALTNFAEGLGLTAKEFTSINKDFQTAEKERKKMELALRQQDRAEQMGLEDKALAARNRAEDSRGRYNQFLATSEQKLLETRTSTALERQKMALTERLGREKIAATREGTAESRAAREENRAVMRKDALAQRYGQEVGRLAKLVLGGMGPMAMTDPNAAIKAEAQARQIVLQRNPQYKEVAGEVEAPATGPVKRYNPATGKLE